MKKVTFNEASTSIKTSNASKRNVTFHTASRLMMTCATLTSSTAATEGHCWYAKEIAWNAC